MSEFFYWPYDELTLSATPNRDTITIKTPWMEAKLQGPFEPKAEFEQLIKKFEEKALSPTDIHLISGFFRNLSQYPFCYILPIQKGASATDNHTVASKSLHEASLEEIISNVVSDKKTVKETLKNLPRQGFVWDTETATSFSKIGEKIHPESLFTVARRFHFLELLENDKGKQVFQFIENLPKEKFAEFASRLVKQNLYVTQECQNALNPALKIAQSAKPVIEHFIQAEKGHDRLLGAAMKALVPDPEKIPVSSQAIALMGLLKLAAQKNFLGFAMAVDFFERGSFEKMDPLAALLLKGGYPEAAKQINRHAEINEVGGHDNMGLQFLQNMAPVDLNYAKEAFKLAESISLVMNSLTGSVKG